MSTDLPQQSAEQPNDDPPTPPAEDEPTPSAEDESTGFILLEDPASPPPELPHWDPTVGRSMPKRTPFADPPPDPAPPEDLDPAASPASGSAATTDPPTAGSVDSPAAGSAASDAESADPAADAPTPPPSDAPANDDAAAAGSVAATDAAPATAEAPIADAAAADDADSAGPASAAESPWSILSTGDEAASDEPASGDAAARSGGGEAADEADRMARAQAMLTAAVAQLIDPVAGNTASAGGSEAAGATDPGASDEEGDEESGEAAVPVVLPEPQSWAGRRLGGWVLEVLLLAVTFFVGWFIWSLRTWARGQSPAKSLLGMRCVRIDTGRVAGWWTMLLRELVGKWLLGVLTAGITVLVSAVLIVGGSRRGIWDRIAKTVVVDDPDGELLG